MSSRPPFSIHTASRCISCRSEIVICKKYCLVICQCSVQQIGYQQMSRFRSSWIGTKGLVNELPCPKLCQSARKQKLRSLHPVAYERNSTLKDNLRSVVYLKAGLFNCPTRNPKLNEFKPPPPPPQSMRAFYGKSRSKVADCMQ